MCTIRTQWPPRKEPQKSFKALQQQLIQSLSRTCDGAKYNHVDNVTVRIGQYDFMAVTLKQLHIHRDVKCHTLCHKDVAQN